MKLVLLCDSHLGVKSDSPIFLEYTESFFKDTLFPYMKANGLTQILHLGDWFDRRKYISYFTLHFMQTRILNLFTQNNVHMDLILGNHDIFYKTNNDINSPNLLLKDHPNITVIDECQNRVYGKSEIACVPWISPTNMAETTKFLEGTQANICAGHFAIQGFHVVRGTPSEDGLDPSLFKKFDMVFSGHFHFKQDNGQIYYLGTQFDLNYGDVYEIKGFHVFDTDTKKLEFIENPNKLFCKIEYHNGFQGDLSRYTKKYVKILVKAKDNPVEYEKFLEALEQVRPHDVTIVDETEIMVSNPEEAIDETQDTLTIISNEIDSLNIEAGNGLKNLVTEIYTEAQELEV